MICARKEGWRSGEREHTDGQHSRYKEYGERGLMRLIPQQSEVRTSGSSSCSEAASSSEDAPVCSVSPEFDWSAASSVEGRWKRGGGRAEGCLKRRADSGVGRA